MKSKKISIKLKLNKQTIANLEKKAMEKVFGGSEITVTPDPGKFPTSLCGC